MASTEKKLVRENFRQAVFERDHHQCRKCEVPAGPEQKLDAHHITDRHDLPNGGYVALNGISLCETCHALAEVWHQSGQDHFEVGYHPNDLYALIGSSWVEAWEASERLTVGDSAKLAPDT